MPTPITSTSLNKSVVDLDANIRIMTGSVLKLHEKEFPDIIKRESSDLRSEKMMRYEGNGAAPEKTEGGKPTDTRLVEGYVEQSVQKTYAHDMPITWEARKYAMSNTRIVNQMGEYQARSGLLRYEQTSVGVINNGTSTSFTGGDGAAYFSASHNWRTSPTVAWSNLLQPATMSLTAVESNLITVEEATIENGIPGALKVQQIDTGTSNVFKLPKILETQQEPDNANNTKNIVSTLGIKQNFNHYLTDKNAYTYDTQVNTRTLYETQSITLKSWMDDKTEDLMERVLCAIGTMFHDTVGSYHNQGA